MLLLLVGVGLRQTSDLSFAGTGVGVGFLAGSLASFAGTSFFEAGTAVAGFNVLSLGSGFDGFASAGSFLSLSGSFLVGAGVFFTSGFLSSLGAAGSFFAGAGVLIVFFDDHGLPFSHQHPWGPSLVLDVLAFHPSLWTL